MAYAQTNLQLYAQLVALGFDEAALRLTRTAYDRAAALFSARLRFSGKPFVAHLVGTASIVAAHGGDVRLVAAALLHAAYEQGDFGTHGRGPRPERREELRGAVGDAVESLVARYDAFDFAAAAFSDADRDVLLLRAANEMEDALDLGVLYAAAPRRKRALEAIGKAAEAAAFLGRAALEAEIRAALTALQTTSLPAPLSGDRNDSPLVAPRSYRRRLSLRLRERLARRLARLRS